MIKNKNKIWLLIFFSILLVGYLVYPKNIWIVFQNESGIPLTVETELGGDKVRKTVKSSHFIFTDDIINYKKSLFTKYDISIPEIDFNYSNNLWLYKNREVRIWITREQKVILKMDDNNRRLIRFL